MAETQASEPVNVIDHDVNSGIYYGSVVITVASCFSSFAMTFKVSKYSTLKEVKVAFSKCADWFSGGLKYLHKGKLVHDEDTPAKLRMKNGDTIHVLAESKFSGSCSQLRRPEFTGEGFELLSVMNPEDSMVITIQAYDGYTEKYRIKPNTDLKKVMAHFKQAKKETTLRFLFDGLLINAGDTPNKLEMEDGCTVEVFREQIGG